MRPCQGWKGGRKERIKNNSFVHDHLEKQPPDSRVRRGSSDLGLRLHPLARSRAVNVFTNVAARVGLLAHAIDS